MLEELINTERSYVNSLQTCVQAFIEPLWSNASTLKIASEDIPKLSCGLEKIVELNRQLLAQMEARREDESIIQALVDFVPALTPLYSAYVANQDVQLRTLERLMQRPSFTAFVAERLQQSTSAAATSYHKNVGLPNFLIMPVQRIPRYVLLSQEVLNATPVAHTDWNASRQAVELLTKMAETVNVSKTQEEHLQKLAEIEKSIVGGAAGCPSLVVASRTFITEGWLCIWESDGRTKQRAYFFLFNDLLIYCEPTTRGLRGFAYNFLGVFELENLVSVLERTHDAPFQAADDQASDDSELKQYRHHFMITICGVDGQLVDTTLSAKSSAERERWITLISQQLTTIVDQRKSLHSVSCARKTGYLYKRGGLNTQWKKRFFELDAERLCYYESYVDTTCPMGSILLEQFNLIAVPYDKFNRRYVFELAPIGAAGRSYFLQAWNETEYQEWLADLAFFVHSTLTSEPK